jgi:hypothetical protein
METALKNIPDGSDNEEGDDHKEEPERKRRPPRVVSAFEKERRLASDAADDLQMAAAQVLKDKRNCARKTKYRADRELIEEAKKSKM